MATLLQHCLDGMHVYSLTMLPDLPADNGILAQVPGQFTGAASMSLPPADSVARDAVLTVDVEAAHVGWVRLSFTPRLAKHRRHRHWYWSAFRADAITAGAREISSAPTAESSGLGCLVATTALQCFEREWVSGVPTPWRIRT
jgi:hypothetical protein